MSLFIATGTNLGDKKIHLNEALEIHSKKYSLIAQSRIYESPAVDYLNQPDFYNQVLEFKTPPDSPESVMNQLLEIEKNMGRNRILPKGPRIIDLDILFWDDLEIVSETLIIPHPRVFDRSFVVLPLSELPGFVSLQKKFQFPKSFDNIARPIS